MRFPLLPILAALSFTSCSVSKQLESSARKNVLSEEALRTAHVGISVFEPATGQYWYNYQGDKYFVPASNIKIPTCYAAMKYLGDSLVAGRVEQSDSAIILFPTGDPTFLHPEFGSQPLYRFLINFNRVDIHKDNWQDDALGSGWSWNDYNASYMAERSAFPVYGNLIRFSFNNGQLTSIPKVPAFRDSFSDALFEIDSLSQAIHGQRIRIERAIADNKFTIYPSTSSFTSVSIPFSTGDYFIQEILKDTLKTFKRGIWIINQDPRYFQPLPHKGLPIHSQPTDSLLKPMMHRSDNFFAEQSLLMASNEFLGVMSDNRIIDTLLKTDFADLPHRPRWVDGSGLSRYNLFTPQDFIAILHKMKKEFGMERIKEIFPTGGEGTLSSYYKKDSTFIYAKTGTLSGVVALSGFLYTRSGKELIFSVLVNNHNGSATAVRRAVEKFIQGIRERY